MNAFVDAKRLSDDAFMALAAQLATRPLVAVLELATGRADWPLPDRRVYSIGDVFYPKLFSIVRVDMTKLKSTLEHFGCAVDANSANGWHRYSADGGNRAVWEEAIAANPALSLPMMQMRLAQAGNRWNLVVSDMSDNAQYVNAVLHANGWPTTLICCHTEYAAAFEHALGAAPVLPAPLRPAFMRIYRHLVIDVLDVLRPGTVIGQAIKLTGSPTLNMARDPPPLASRRKVPARGNLWRYLDHEVTTEELLEEGHLPPAAVMVQVHHRLVDLLMKDVASGTILLPPGVLATYQRRGVFAHV